MSITDVDRIGGFVVGDEANYNASTFGKSIFFAPNTKQLLVDGVKYIPKKLSELVNDVNYLTSSALNTWQGTANITTLGTITSGVWNGSKIANSYLANSSITISGESVSLGGSITQSALRTALGLGSNAYTSTAYLPLAGGTLTGLLQTGSKLQFNTTTSKSLIEVYNVDNGCTYPILSFDTSQESLIIGHNDVAKVEINGTTSVGELIIGTPDTGKSVRLYYDTTNDCLRVDKGVASDSFVSAGDVDSSEQTIAELQARIEQLEAQVASLSNN